MTTAKTAEKTAPKTLAEALSDFQKDLPEVKFDAVNPAFKSKFATLGAVTKAVIPKLTEHGFAFSVGSFVDNGLLIVDAHLIHQSGESRSLQFPITETNPQKIGSALTYARRYALTALTGVVADEDDDGNTASVPSPAQAAVTRAKNATAKPPATDPQSIIRAAITAGTVTKEAVNGAMDELKEKGLTGAKLYEAIIEKVGIGT